MTTLSVVMVTHNNLYKVRKCLSSWLSFIPAMYVAEWLVLDNCSTDGTRQWLRTLKRHTKKLRLIESEENLGCAGGRHKLFSAAKGDLVFSLDSDVLLRNRGGIHAMMHTLKNDNTVGIVGDHGGWVLPDWSWTEEAPDKYSGTAPIVTGYCQMFRRSALKHVELDLAYNPYWLEDSDFCLQILTKLNQTGYVMPCGVRHEWSQTNSGDKTAQKSKWAYFRSKWQARVGGRAFKPND